MQCHSGPVVSGMISIDHIGGSEEPPIPQTVGLKGHLCLYLMLSQPYGARNWIKLRSTYICKTHILPCTVSSPLLPFYLFYLFWLSGIPGGAQGLSTQGARWNQIRSAMGKTSTWPNVLLLHPPCYHLKGRYLRCKGWNPTSDDSIAVSSLSETIECSFLDCFSSSQWVSESRIPPSFYLHIDTSGQDLKARVWAAEELCCLLKFA